MIESFSEHFKSHCIFMAWANLWFIYRSRITFLHRLDKRSRWLYFLFFRYNYSCFLQTEANLIISRSCFSSISLAFLIPSQRLCNSCSLISSFFKKRFCKSCSTPFLGWNSKSRCQSFLPLSNQSFLSRAASLFVGRAVSLFVGRAVILFVCRAVSHFWGHTVSLFLGCAISIF